MRTRLIYRLKIMGTLLIVFSLLASSNLTEGIRAVQDFRAEEGIVYLEQAKQEGPYKYEDHRLLYENLAVGFAYLNRHAESLAAFDILLSLDAGHVVSYTLSPKVTFLFEKARQAARLQEATEIQLNWPELVGVDQSLAFIFEVVADRQSMLKQGVFFKRLAGEPSFSFLQFNLAPLHQKGRLELPPQATDAVEDKLLEFYFVGLDAAGNEVLRWAESEHPRKLLLKYTPPTLWYKKWWVWALGGSVLAGATGALVYATNYEVPSLLQGDVGVPW